MRGVDAETLSQLGLSQIALGKNDPHALSDGPLLCHAQSFAQRNPETQALSLRHANFFTATTVRRMLPPKNLSAAVRSKVNTWLELQPRGTQTEMARFVGVKGPALSNYLRGRRSAMRADNIGRVLEFLRLRAPELAGEIDVQEPDGMTSPDHTDDPKSTSKRTTGDVDGTSTNSLDQLTKENTALRIALDKLADELKRLAAVVKPRKVAATKSHPRGRR